MPFDRFIIVFNVASNKQYSGFSNLRCQILLDRPVYKIKKHYLATAEPISEDEFFLEVKENGDVTVIMEVDREDMGDTNNIYTVTFAATEPDDGCTEPPCEALTNVTFRIQVVYFFTGFTIIAWMSDLS